jgi:hypothetical protein
MFNPNTTQNVALNSLQFTVNGHKLEGFVTDEVAEKLWSIISTAVSGGQVATPVSTPSVEDKKQYVYKDTETKWEIVKFGNLYCIQCRLFGKAARSISNGHIKALEGIKETKVDREDGKGSFKAWGYSTKKKAEEMMATLPKVLPADVLNAKSQELRSRGR